MHFYIILGDLAVCGLSSSCPIWVGLHLFSVPQPPYDSFDSLTFLANLFLTIEI